MSAPASMYAHLMGTAFGRLAPAVRDFHSLSGRNALRGQVETEAPQGGLARLLAWALGTPQRHVQGAIRFELDTAPTVETWTRHFPQRVMRSRIDVHGGQLVERLGGARLCFDVAERDGALVLDLRSMRFFGMPCPTWLMPRVRAVETGHGRALHFEVSARLPGIGTVAGYRGHLDLATLERLA